MIMSINLAVTSKEVQHFPFHDLSRVAKYISDYDDLCSSKISIKEPESHKMGILLLAC